MVYSLPVDLSKEQTSSFRRMIVLSTSESMCQDPNLGGVVSPLRLAFMAKAKICSAGVELSLAKNAVDRHNDSFIGRMRNKKNCVLVT